MCIAGRKFTHNYTDIYGWILNICLFRFHKILMLKKKTCALSDMCVLQAGRSSLLYDYTRYAVLVWKMHLYFMVPQILGIEQNVKQNKHFHLHCACQLSHFSFLILWFMVVYKLICYCFVFVFCISSFVHIYSACICSSGLQFQFIGAVTAPSKLMVKT